MSTTTDRCTPNIETVMATDPGVRYPRSRVERVLEALAHPRTWEEFAVAARDRGWEAAADAGVSLRDLWIMALRTATPEQCILGVVRGTHLRLATTVRRWPEVSPAVDDVRRRLLAWQGDLAELDTLRSAADAAARAAASDDIDAADAVAKIAFDARFDVEDAGQKHAYLHAFYENAWDNLLFICRLLDGGPSGGPEEIFPEAAWLALVRRVRQGATNELT